MRKLWNVEFVIGPHQANVVDEAAKLLLSLSKLRVNSLLCKFETSKIKYMVALSCKLYTFAVENNFWFGALMLVDVT